MRKGSVSSAPVVAVRRKDRTGQQRREMVEAYELSGLSQAALCEREGMSTRSLANWRRDLRGDVSTPAPRVGVMPAPTFIELGSTRPLDVGVRVRIELGAGVVLELSRG
jgi:transposase-like protein